MIKVIRVMGENESDNSFLAPLFVCDVCGKEIRHLEQGLATFDRVPFEEGALRNVRVAHKGSCDTQNDAEHQWWELTQMLNYMLQEQHEWEVENGRG